MKKKKKTQCAFSLCSIRSLLSKQPEIMSVGLNVAKKEPSYTLVKPLWKTMEIPYKLRIKLSYDPPIRFGGIYPKNIRMLYQKDRYMLPYIS